MEATVGAWHGVIRISKRIANKIGDLQWGSCDSNQVSSLSSASQTLVEACLSAARSQRLS